MANTKYSYFILTGEPGVGKTTLIQKLFSILRENAVKVVGFYTEEVRNNRIREGFDVVTLDGVRGRLARDQSLLNSPVRFKVGKYGVLVQEFEDIALPSLKKSEDIQQCILIDEIGKMEFFSDTFKTCIKEIFHPNSKNVVLATIPFRKSDAIIESIRNNSKSKVWVVTKENRNTILDDILKEMRRTLNF